MSLLSYTGTPLPANGQARSAASLSNIFLNIQTAHNDTETRLAALIASFSVDGTGNIVASVGFKGNLTAPLTSTQGLFAVATSLTNPAVIARSAGNAAGNAALMVQNAGGGTVATIDALGAAVLSGNLTAPSLFVVAANTVSPFIVRAAGTPSQPLWSGQSGGGSPATTSVINSDGSSSWSARMTANSFAGDGTLITNVTAVAAPATGLSGIIPVANYGDRTITAAKIADLAPSAQSTPGMTIHVAPGDYPSSTNVLVRFAGGDTAAFTAPGVGVDRIDAVSLDDSGNRVITPGTAAASPVPPPWPAGKQVTCVYLRSGCTAIFNSDQGTLATGYIMSNSARFFGGNGGSGGGGGSGAPVAAPYLNWGGGFSGLTAPINPSTLFSGSYRGGAPTVVNGADLAQFVTAPKAVAPDYRQVDLSHILSQFVSQNAMLSLQASGAALQLTVLNGNIEFGSNAIWNEITATTTTGNTAGSAGMYKLVATLSAIASAPTLRLTQGSPLTSEIELANCYWDGANWQLYIVWWPAFQQVVTNTTTPAGLPRFSSNTAGGGVTSASYAAIPTAPPPLQTIYLPTPMYARVRYVMNASPSVSPLWAEVILLIDGSGATSGIEIQNQGAASLNTFGSIYESPSPLAIGQHTFQLQARNNTASSTMTLSGITVAGEFYR